jgi:TRAP-type C4-dicarboxylate transport system permease small subunit
VTGLCDLLFGRWGLRLAAAALAVALAVMAAQVIGRYVLGSSIIWAEELARYALIWSAMIGSAVAYREGAHIGVTVLIDALPRRLQRPLARLVHLAALAFALVVTWQGWFLAMRNFDRGQTSPALQIDIAWIYLAVPVGGALLALAALEALWRGVVPRPSEGGG